MPHRMLIDASHPEETRVVVTDGKRLEEFDYEAASKKQLKGNIYLAKVTRVEPSLQAAFIEFGGNRHGFLSFNEVHADYYQIPVADRQALAAEQAELEREAARGEAEDAPSTEATGDGAGEEASGPVEQLAGSEDDIAVRRPRTSSRNYKIQEVVRKRQILLVQVLKEERGTKGAALSTYISIPGRYCVLMPNTPRGGGISRKITDARSRKRLRTIATDLQVPEGMGVIIRTAGLERTKADIKRDFDYLLRQWEEIRSLTLKSTAPSLVYEEANLIKRALRDLYSNELEEVLVEGDDAYRTAKDFMRMMMPSHAKRVKPYKELVPLFQRHQIEGQLDAMHSPNVQLRSGGYIVINPTEALVSIDVNSGRSTRERNIEDTALKTNIEAAEEIARQVRLRDLAGLIVVDYIDMDDRRNDRQVERCFKEALKHDRARIQLGRISPFGLLEMSRQRMRPSFLETSTTVCPHCGGQGHVRSRESTALHVLRALEEEAVRERAAEIVVHVPTSIALYLLNQKRASISGLEERFGLRIIVERDDTLIPPNYRMDRVKAKTAAPAAEVVVAEVAVAESAEAEPEAEAEAEAEAQADDEAVAAPAKATEDGVRRRPRRRRRREPEPQGAAPAAAPAATDDAEPEREDAAGDEPAAAPEPRPDQAAQGDGEHRRRRRGRRGGRRRGRREDLDTPSVAVASADYVDTTPVEDEGSERDEDAPATEPAPTAASEDDSWPLPTREPEPAAPAEAEREIAAAEPVNGDGTPEPARPSAAQPRRTPAPEERPAEPKRGWWQRLTE